MNNEHTYTIPTLEITLILVTTNTFLRTLLLLLLFCLLIKWLNLINKLRFNAEVLNYVAVNGIT